MEILELLDRNVKTTTRQRAWEVLMHLCAPIHSPKSQNPFIIQLQDSHHKHPRKTVQLSRGNKEVVAVHAVSVVDDMSQAIQDRYFGYIQGKLTEVAIGNMGLGYNYATGFKSKVPNQFATQLKSFDGIEGFPHAVKLYIRISLRLRGAVGYRLAGSLEFKKNERGFHGHIAMVYNLLHVDVNLLKQMHTHVRAISPLLPLQWGPVVMNLMHFLQEKKTLHQAIFAQLRLLHTRQDLESSDLFSVERNLNGEMYLRITSLPTGQPPKQTLIGNLSLYHPLNVTIDSAHWTHLRDVIAHDPQFPAFRNAALQCMHENRLLWYQQPSQVGVERYKNLFEHVQREVAMNEEAILGFVTRIASSLISAPMRQVEHNFLYNIMGAFAHAA